MADPIRHDCYTTYRASRSSGHRDPATIRWIVMHSTEGGTAQSVARYFTTKNAAGSAHLIVDDNECYRTLRNDQIPWAAPGANTRGFHIEQCGYAHWTSAQWKEHMGTLERGAYKAAFHCHKFGIPPVFVGMSGLKAKRPGITTHAECTRAFGGNHTDPGSGWPQVMFLTLVKRYYDELGGPDV